MLNQSNQKYKGGVVSNIKQDTLQSSKMGDNK